MRDGLTDVMQFACAIDGVSKVRIDSGVVPRTDKKGEPTLDKETGKPQFTEDVTTAYAKTENGFLRIRGDFHKKWPGVDNNILGIGDIKLMKFMLGADFLASEGSSVTLIETADKEAKEIKFRGADDNNTSHYKLMSRSAVYRNIRPFSPIAGGETRAEFSPTMDSIKKFLSCASAFASSTGGMGKTVMFEKAGPEILVNYGGQDGNSSLKTPFASDAGEGDMVNGFEWDVGTLASLLKLVNDKIVKFSFRDNATAVKDGGFAVLEAVVDSGAAKWSYYMTPMNMVNVGR